MTVPTEPRLPIAAIADFQKVVTGLYEMSVLAESCLVEFLPDCVEHDRELARRIDEAQLALRSLNAHLAQRIEKGL